MSYGSSYGGGGRRRRRGEIAVLDPSTTTFKHRPDDYDHYDYRREAPESPDQKLKTAIIKFGEVVRVAVPRVGSSYRDARRMQSRSFLNLPPNCVLRSNPVSPQLPKVFAWRMLSFFL